MNFLHLRFRHKSTVFQAKNFLQTLSLFFLVLGTGRHGTVHEQNQECNLGSGSSLESRSDEAEEKDPKAGGGELQRRSSHKADPDGRRDPGEHQASGGEI